jgi:hypothetical protein
VEDGPDKLKLIPQGGFAANRRKSKGKNLCAGPRAGWGRNLQGLVAIKTIVNDAIVNDSILQGDGSAAILGGKPLPHA